MLKQYTDSKVIFNSLQLQKTQETTNQVRQSAEKLSNKMKQTRDELEEDLKEARDVVKELKDFLSGKDCFSAEGRWRSGLICGRKVHLVSVII